MYSKIQERNCISFLVKEGLRERMEEGLRVGKEVELEEGLEVG